MNDSALTTSKTRVLNRSAFNKSFQNLLTSKVGTLTPVLTDEVIPDSIVKLRGAFLGKMPPLASDTFMRVKLHIEAFFVPHRLLYGGFGDYMSGQSYASPSSTGAPDPNVRVIMPYLRPWNRAGNDYGVVGTGSISDTSSGAYQSWRENLGPGSLADYLGFKQAVGVAGTTDAYSQVRLNMFPFLAYHRIYDDWYRNPLIQAPVFVLKPNNIHEGLDQNYNPAHFPFVTFTGYGDSVGGDSIEASSRYVQNTLSCDFVTDGHRIGALRQRNFGRDYFTSATPRPTVGAMPELVIDTSGSEGSFTIGVLRSVNALTQFAERNAIAGTRYTDWLQANYGVRPKDAVLQRPRYLGRLVFDMYSKGVYQTNRPDGYAQEGPNPFDSVGAQFGDAVATGEGDLIDDFYVDEPGTIMVLASLVPKVSYTTGSARYLRHFTRPGSRADVANQIFENVGPQPIYKSELDGSVLAATDPDAVFGYTDRYAEFKTKPDEVHGLMRDGESLEAFALQRGFGLAGAELGSEFLQIPTDYLDQVAAVQDSISRFGYWLDCAFDYKVVQPLSRYSNPSLVMPAELNGHDEFFRRAGSYL